MEGQRVAADLDREGRRAQAENGAQLVAAHRHAADAQCGDEARVVARKVREKAAGVPVELRRGVGRKKAVAEFLRGEGHDGVVVRHKGIVLGAVHALEIGQVGLPDLARALRVPCGGGEKDRQHRLAVVNDHLAVRLRHGPRELFLVVERARTPAGRRVLGGLVGLAAGDVVAGVRVGMARNGALRHLVQRVGPRGDRLRLERLELERGGHLRAQHAEQVFVHRHLLDLAAVQHAQRARMVRHRGVGTPHLAGALTGRLRLLRRLPRGRKAPCEKKEKGD